MFKNKKITMLLTFSLMTATLAPTTANAGSKMATGWAITGASCGLLSYWLAAVSVMANKIATVTVDKADLAAEGTTVEGFIMVKIDALAFSMTTGALALITGSSSLFCFYKAYENFVDKKGNTKKQQDFNNTSEQDRQKAQQIVTNYLENQRGH